MLPFARRARVWPGAPYPLGATWDGAGSTSRCSRRTPRRSSSASSTSAASASSSGSSCPSTPTRSGTATCPTCRPGQLYGYRVHGPYDPQRPSLQPAQAAARSLRQAPRRRRCAGSDALFGYRIGDADGGPVLRRARQRRRHAQCRGGRPRLHLGRRPPAAHALARDAHLRAARQGLHQAASRTCREQLRGTYAGLGHRRRSIEHLRSLGVTAVELCRCTPSSTTATWSRRG